MSNTTYKEAALKRWDNKFKDARYKAPNPGYRWDSEGKEVVIDDEMVEGVNIT